MVLMMKPSVGLTVLTSSFMIFLTMVVFPALSRPLIRHSQRHSCSADGGKNYSINMRISLSLRRALRSMDSMMMLARVLEHRAFNELDKVSSL
jgi:hypothetical protein